MSEVSDLMSAVASMMVPIGGAIAFVWAKVEHSMRNIRREQRSMQRELLKCQRDRAVKLTVIELLWQVVVKHEPSSPILDRAKRLLDRIKDDDTADRLDLIAD